MADIYAPYADANKMVMLFPQAKDCWGAHADEEMEGLDPTYFTKDDP